MNAVDTNIVVRFLIHDDPQQTAAAQRLFAAPVWIAKTVLAETAWLLRSFYGFDRDAIRQVTIMLMGMENVHMEGGQSVAAALDLVGHGLDLADALHLTSRPAGATFVSFDQTFVKRAKRAGVVGVTAPPI